jgi:hypothetical protein
MILTLKKPSELNPERPPVFCREFVPIMQSSVSMLFSGGGVGKSYASIKMAIAYVLETGRKAALWLTEDSEGENKYRFDSLVNQSFPQHSERLNNSITMIANRPVQFTKMDNGNAVLTREFWKIRLELADFGLIFIDPLLQFNGCDENSNTHAGVLMGALKEWTDEENKSIVLIHHAAKSKEGGIRARGAGEWQNGCRSVFRLSKIYNDDETLDTAQLQKLQFELVKDNGLSYYFRNETTGELSRKLRIFPDYEQNKTKETISNNLFLSVATHNTVSPENFIKVDIDYFYGMHKIVTAGKAYSQYDFEKGYRLGTNNKGNATIICLDFDDGMTIEQAKKKFEKIQCLIITTRSHQKDKSGKKCDRFRVIIPLSEPLSIPLSDYPGFLDCLNEVTGGEVDRSTKDLARFYFSSPEDAAYWYSDSEKRMNWRLIYDKMRKQKVKENIEKKLQEPRKEYSGQPKNTLPKDTLFETRNGSQTFSGFRDSLSVGDKEPVKCLDGIDHGSLGKHHLSAFVKKDSNGNVFYSCSGGRCAGNETKWCED